MKFLNKDEDGKFVVLTIPIEKNPSYGTGAAKGCFAIIKESLELEYYDEEFNNSPVEKGIQTVNLENLEEVTDFVKNTDKFVIALGGDHSIGIGILNGLEDFSKHHAILCTLLNGGAEYAVYMTTAHKTSGSMSGATTNEAKSWGKVKDDSDVSTVIGDVTIMFPLAMIKALEELKEDGLLNG